ncbi:uncharacterized protein AB675_4350 [Cyphellophora attinorum]|uniref:KOW domain-containing protein n=1 Tax=Cyphellophora attinorum TaxID=1664694 RepID=A0A0N1GZG6_9EURO|nr:uncharacterized protein AB675_4350 [Phialophora attinorum]KPI36564.1 hypothetical protein AB675_4350 [Phialophora attinorum]
MQKILRINIQQQKQNLKAQVRVAEREIKGDISKYVERNREIISLRAQLEKQERKHRREDWFAGPLAPDRNNGLEKGKLGGLDSNWREVMKGKPESMFREKDRPKHGNKGNIVEGDRVVVIEGVDKGKIGEVEEVNEEEDTVTLKGVAMADIITPAIARPSLLQNPPCAPSPPHPPLLHPPRHKNVRPNNPHLQRLHHPLLTKRRARSAPPPHTNLPPRLPGSSLPPHDRFITGTNIRVDWPAEERSEGIVEDGDTRREVLDAYTYNPGFYVNAETGEAPEPLPHPDIIEEIFKPRRLGGGRTQHDVDYVARKIIEDARSAWYRGRRLVGPGQEAWEAEVLQRKSAFGKAVKEDEEWRAAESERIRAEKGDLSVGEAKGDDVSVEELLPDGDTAVPFDGRIRRVGRVVRRVSGVGRVEGVRRVEVEQMVTADDSAGPTERVTV